MRRAAVVVLLACVGLLFGAGTAAADLVLVPEQLDPGAREVTLTFRITEDDPSARPTRLQVFLPTGRPLVGVRAPAPPGWTAQLTTTRLDKPAPSPDGPVSEIVTVVDWTATAPAPSIVELPLVVGAMPDGAGPVRFRALRTDAAGRTEEWSNTWVEGGPRPAHDALLIRYGPPPPPVPVGTHGDHHGESAAAVAAAPTGPATPAAVATTIALSLAAAAGIAALTVVLGRRQRRRFAALAGPPPATDAPARVAASPTAAD